MYTLQDAKKKQEKKFLTQNIFNYNANVNNGESNRENENQNKTNEITTKIRLY